MKNNLLTNEHKNILTVQYLNKNAHIEFSAYDTFFWNNLPQVRS